MKILPLNFIQNSNYNSISNKNIQKEVQIKNENFLNSYPREYFLTPSFTSCMTPKQFELRTLSDMPCAFCNKNMITQDEAREFAFGSNELRGYDLIHALNSKREYYGEVENEVADIIIQSAKTFDEADVSEILNIIRAQMVAKLSQEQTKILNQFDFFTKTNLPPHKYKQIREVTSRSRKLVSDRIKSVNYEKFFRDEFLVAMKMQKPPFDDIDPETFEKMWLIVTKYPKSNNSASALAVKYSKREPEELFLRLVSNRTTSVEHIMPSTNGGTNNSDNYILLCRECNNVRGHTSYEEIFEENPQIKENIEKFLIEAQKRINDEKIEGLENYAFNVADTIFNESCGKIDLRDEFTSDAGDKNENLGFNTPNEFLRTLDMDDLKSPLAKTAVKVLIEYAKSNPDLSLEELFHKAANEQIEEVKAVQIKKIEKIRNMTQMLEFRDSQKVRKILNNYLKNVENLTFKPTALLQECDELGLRGPIINDIKAKIKLIPGEKTNVWVFFAKNADAPEIKIKQLLLKSQSEKIEQE